MWRLVKTVAGSVVLLFPPMPIIINPNDEPKDIGLGSIACRNTYPFSETSRRVWKRGKYFCEGKKAGPTETLGEEGGCLKELRWLSPSSSSHYSPTPGASDLPTEIMLCSVCLYSQKLGVDDKTKTVPLELLRTARTISESTTCLWRTSEVV